MSIDNITYTHSKQSLNMCEFKWQKKTRKIVKIKCREKLLFFIKNALVGCDNLKYLNKTLFTVKRATK